MSDFPCCEPADVQVGHVFDMVALENVRLRDEFARFKTLTAAIEKQLGEKLAAAQQSCDQWRSDAKSAEAELLKRGLVIQNLWTRLDELVAERNATQTWIAELREAASTPPVDAWLLASIDARVAPRTETTP